MRKCTEREWEREKQCFWRGEGWSDRESRGMRGMDRWGEKGGCRFDPLLILNIRWKGLSLSLIRFPFLHSFFLSLCLWQRGNQKISLPYILRFNYRDRTMERKHTHVHAYAQTHTHARAHTYTRLRGCVNVCVHVHASLPVSALPETIHQYQNSGPLFFNGSYWSWLCVLISHGFSVSTVCFPPFQFPLVGQRQRFHCYVWHDDDFLGK